MMFKSAVTALLLLSGAIASPIVAREAKAADNGPADKSTETASVYEWNKGWTKEYTIHQSCNSTLRRQLREGLDDALELAQHAKDHLLRFGSESDFVKKYFGNHSTASPIGWYDRIVNADKTGILFRCDDPDRNCATQNQWAGHHRGKNGTLETVICPLSFEIRRPLSSVCNQGYTVTNSKLNTFWATDLMHRILHVPTINENTVEHFAEDYAGALQLAKTNPSKSVIDSNAIQYFAIDVYAYDIAAPGVGCSGELKVKSSSTEATPSTTSAATATSEAPKECHTHDDGVVHCS